jgi:small subunit ribosomal protein S12
MTTINQLATKKSKRLHKIKWTPSKKLLKCPFKKGTVYIIYNGSPKKPNSGKRKLAKVVLSTGKKAMVTIPDGNKGGQRLQKFDKVLIRGGRSQDMPGVHYKILRSNGKRRSDTMDGSIERRQRRSKFGTSKVF